MTPPIWLPVASVSRSLPLPCASPVVEQLNRGRVALLPVAVRQAPLVPLVGVGLVTVPVPSTVRSLNAFWKSTVPAARAGVGATTKDSDMRTTAMITTPTSDAVLDPAREVANDRPGTGPTVPVMERRGDRAAASLRAPP